MKYALMLGALLVGGLSSVEAYSTYSYPTYVYQEAPVVYERYVQEVPVCPVRVVRRYVEPVRYYYPECRPCYRYHHRCHHNPFRGGFSFSFGF